MAINFPTTPSTNQTYTFNGRTWTWNGVGWQATGSTGLTVYTKTDFTATAGQTSFSATYTVGFVDVYYNGSKLSTSEYTATTGSTVVLGTAAALGDIVETIAWTISSSFNPSLGSASATSLAIGGATIGSNALAVTGKGTFSTAIQATGTAAFASGVGLELGYDGVYAYVTGYNRNTTAYAPLALNGSVIDVLPGGVFAARFDANNNFLMGTTGITGGLNGKVINLFGSSTVRNITQTTGQYAVINIGSGGTSATPTTSAFLYTDATANIALVGTGTSSPLTFNINGSEVGRFSTSGYLGVGTASPGAPLEVYSSIASYPPANPILKLNNPSATGQSALDFYINSTFRGRLRADYAGNLTLVANGGGIYFFTGGDSGTGSLAATITGTSLAVAGALSKGSGSFRIDHPHPALTETHQLVHSFIEGPKADLIYRGKAELVAGAASINIDTVSTMTEGTFVVLCRDVQCFTTNESDWTPVRGSVSGNILTIVAQDDTSTAAISWMVIGERQDKHIMETEWTDENGRVIVEPLKPAPVEPTSEAK